MIQMGFCGISGKRLWVKSDRHIIKPNHGVEQTQVLQTVATEFSCSFDGYMIINYKSGSLVKSSLPYIQEIEPGYFRIRWIIDDFFTKIEVQRTEKSLKRWFSNAFPQGFRSE